MLLLLATTLFKKRNIQNTQETTHNTQAILYIYIYAFSRRFYPKWLTLHSSYSFTFYQLLLSLGIEPMILALLAPCSTIWATGKLYIAPPRQPAKRPKLLHSNTQATSHSILPSYCIATPKRPARTFKLLRSNAPATSQNTIPSYCMAMPKQLARTPYLLHSNTQATSQGCVSQKQLWSQVSSLPMQFNGTYPHS